MNKKLAALAIVASLSANICSAQVVDFGAGLLYSSTNQTTTMTNGARINLLSLDTGSWSGLGNLTNLFSNLTGSWTPAGSTLVGAVAMNNDGGAGLLSGSFTFNYSGAFGAGDELLLVAYPTLNLSSTSPGNSAPGFFFRATSTNTFFDGSTMVWQAPNPGNWTLGAYNTNQGGSFADGQFTSGAGSQASSDASVLGGGFTTVPEPSTYALLAMSGLALCGYMIRRRSRA